jgi:hypothetical protein
MFATESLMQTRTCPKNYKKLMQIKIQTFKLKNFMKQGMKNTREFFRGLCG